MSRKKAGTDLVPLTTAQRADLERALSDTRRAALTFSCYAGVWSGRLLPPEQIAFLKAKLEPFLKPANRLDVAKAVAMLFASFPRSGVDNPDAYAHAVIMELEEYPLDVVVEVMRRARRTLTFVPTIAELRKIADALVEERRNAMDLLSSMEAEHARREEQRRMEETARKKLSGPRMH